MGIGDGGGGSNAIRVLEGTLRLSSDKGLGSGPVVTFAPPGSDESGEMCIQPGTASVTETDGGNYLIAFTAFLKASASSVAGEYNPDPQVSAEQAVKSLLYRARLSKSVKSERVLLTSGGWGDYSALTSRVVGGSIKRIDNNVVDLWNSNRALLWSVVIEILPWAEYPPETTSAYELSCYGGIMYSGEYQGSGTADARIKRISVYPEKENSRFSKIWIGVKPNLTIDGDSLVGNLITTLNISLAQNGAGVSNFTDAESFGGAVKQISYAASGKSLSSWRPRIFMNYMSWTSSDPIDKAKYMTGKYRLLARPKFPKRETRIGDPKWGVRARLMYGYGTEAWQEISRTPEFIFPDVGNSEYYSYYDLGQIEIGGSHYSQILNDSTRSTIVMDTALLNIDSNYTYSDTYQAPWLTNWTRFDDFILLPAESYVYIKLPRFIQSGERLDIYVDDFGNVEAYAVDREFGGDRDKRLVYYKAQTVVTGEDGFYLPGAGGGALVFVADTDPAHEFANDATFDRVDLVVNKRVQGGPL